MNRPLQLLFWGYFFIFLRIHFGFDLLPDPVGYYFIYLACSTLINKYPHAQKAKLISLIGIAYSIPGVVINLSAPEIHGGWEIYSYSLLVLKLIVAYYLFTVLKSIVTDYDIRALLNRTSTVCTYYLYVYLGALALASFSMNISNDQWIFLNALIGIGVVIMDIVFLLLLGAIRREEPAPVQKSYYV